MSKYLTIDRINCSVHLYSKMHPVIQTSLLPKWSVISLPTYLQRWQWVSRSVDLKVWSAEQQPQEVLVRSANSWPHLRPAESETRGWGPKCAKEPSR